MQTREQTTNFTTNITNHPQAVKQPHPQPLPKREGSNYPKGADFPTKTTHSPLLGRGVGGEAVVAVKSTHSPLSWRGVGGEASIRSMTRKELAQLAGVSERTLRRWLHSNHNQLIAAGYQASQRKLPPRVVKYLMEFYGIER